MINALPIPDLGDVGVGAMRLENQEQSPSPRKKNLSTPKKGAKVDKLNATIDVNDQDKLELSPAEDRDN